MSTSSTSSTSARFPRGLRYYKLISSSYPVEWDYEGEERFCCCKLKAPRRTSWTVTNPGRRFYACGRYPGPQCRFYLFHDPEISEWTKDVILELKWREKALYEEAMEREREVNNLKNAAELAELEYVEILEKNALLEWENGNLLSENSALKSEVKSLKMKIEAIELVNAKRNKDRQCMFAIIVGIVIVTISVNLGGKLKMFDGGVLKALP